jgi:hypothetical protein
MTRDEARTIRRRHEPHLLKQAGVHGASLQTDEQGEPCLVLFVDPGQDTSLLPRDVEGLTVRCERIERFSAQEA